MTRIQHPGGAVHLSHAERHLSDGVRGFTDEVAFLAGDDAARITGHTIPVDGGYLAV